MLTIGQTLILIWWFVSARKWFKGPKVNLEHLMLGREDQAEEIRQTEGDKGQGGATIVIEGKDTSSLSSAEGTVPGQLPPGKQ